MSLFQKSIPCIKYLKYFFSEKKSSLYTINYSLFSKIKSYFETFFQVFIRIGLLFLIDITLNLDDVWVFSFLYFGHKKFNIYYMYRRFSLLFMFFFQVAKKSVKNRWFLSL